MDAARRHQGTSRFTGLFWALVLSNFLSIALYVVRTIDAGNNRHAYFLWNLTLAWLPVLFAWMLGRRLKSGTWLSAGNIVLTLLWLGFLPNSFYLASDLIHLGETGEVSLLYDAVMFLSFIFNGFIAGFLSLLLVHGFLLERVRRRDAHFIISLVLLLCGFAIYLGRYLRWNTWDVLLSPAGILFDVSERVINPIEHPQAFMTTFTFFALLGTMYIVVFHLVVGLLKKR